MVHERDDRRAHALDEVRRQGAIGEAIDDERGSRPAQRQSARFGEVGELGSGNEPGSSRCRTATPNCGSSASTRRSYM